MLAGGKVVKRFTLQYCTLHWKHCCTIAQHPTVHTAVLYPVHSVHTAVQLHGSLWRTAVESSRYTVTVSGTIVVRSVHHCHRPLEFDLELKI